MISFFFNLYRLGGKYYVLLDMMSFFYFFLKQGDKYHFLLDTMSNFGKSLSNWEINTMFFEVLVHVFFF